MYVVVMVEGPIQSPLTPLAPGSPDRSGSRSAPTPAQGWEGVVTGTLPGGPLHLEALAIVVGLKLENVGLTV